MAIGISGSNGGISEVYREIAIADVEAGLNKYERLQDTAPEDVKPFYETIVTSLRELRDNMALEEKGLASKV